VLMELAMGVRGVQIDNELHPDLTCLSKELGQPGAPRFLGSLHVS
jgi:hypothetical protein